MRVASRTLVLVVALATAGGTMGAQQHVISSCLKSSAVQDLQSNTFSVQDSLRFGARKVSAPTPDRGKSTSLAMLLSAVVPGAGQVYAERYWSIPIIWGFGVYFYSQRKYADDKHQQFSDLYSQSLHDTTVQDPLRSSYLTQRDGWRDERDRFTIYLALTYVLNIVDAYVGASLYGFDVSDNLGGGAAIRFRMPIR